MGQELAEGQADGKFSLVVIFTPNGIYDSVEELQDILRDIDTKLNLSVAGDEGMSRFRTPWTIYAPAV
jgi:hypothetical protein